MMQRAVLVAAVASVAVLAALVGATGVDPAVAGAVAAAAEQPPSPTLAYQQEAEAFATVAAAAAAPKTPADWSAEDAFMASFVELQGDGMRKKSRAMATRFVEDLRAALKATYPAAGALSAAAKSAEAAFDKNFRRACKQVSPSRKMCKNFVTIYRLQFRGQNPFAVKNGNRKRFGDAVREVILRWVVAWRARFPKRSKRAGGNPWSPVARAAAAKKSGSDDATADPMADVQLSTGVHGGLNRFGRINAKPAPGNAILGVKPEGDYPLGSALDKPYKARRHVKELRAKVLDDLQFLRDKLYTKISDKKFHRMVGNPQRAPQVIRRVARLCKRSRKERFLPPTFCKSLEYLASVNFVGRNFMRNLKDFSALMASFMDHNHKYTTRYGFRVHRKPNYRQDVTVVRAKLALKLRPTRFHLRTFAREFVNIVSNVLAVPQRRIRVASVKLGGFFKGRRHTTVTFEFLPKKGDRRIRSRPNRIDSVDALAEQFRAMAIDRPKSDFYRVPILSRILPRTLVLSKTLGRRPKNARYNLQSKNVPRFAAVDASQTLAAETAEAEAEDASAVDSAADAEAVEFEQSDAEFLDSDEALDTAEAEAVAAAGLDAEAEAEADELDAELDAEEAGADSSDEELSAEDAAELAEAEAVAQHVADTEAHVETVYTAAMNAEIEHAQAGVAASQAAEDAENEAGADATEVAADADAQAETETETDAVESEAAAEVAAQSEAAAEAESEAAAANGEVALLQLAVDVDASASAGAGAAVAAEAAALHLSAETLTQEELDAEEAAEDAEDEAEEAALDAEEAADEDEADADDEADDEDEAVAEDELEADEEVDEEVDVADDQEQTLAADEEVETDAEWQTALLQNREQLVASSEEDDALDESDDAEDEAEADAALDAEADDELDAELDAEADAEVEGAAGVAGAAVNADALTAPAESWTPLPEVNADAFAPSSEELVTTAANNDKAVAASAVIAQALAAVDAEEAAAETVFVETQTTVVAAQQQQLQRSAATPAAAAGAATVALPALLAAAALLLAKL